MHRKASACIVIASAKMVHQKSIRSLYNGILVYEAVKVFALNCTLSNMRTGTYLLAWSYHAYAHVSNEAFQYCRMQLVCIIVPLTVQHASCNIIICSMEAQHVAYLITLCLSIVILIGKFLITLSVTDSPILGEISLVQV